MRLQQLNGIADYELTIFAVKIERFSVVVWLLQGIKKEVPSNLAFPVPLPCLALFGFRLPCAGSPPPRVQV